ncbi:hypothetical protein [Amycolatopsis sp. cmx-4-68]|uniref:hypothetical protein n=1 Tax=Amycolatopsis sp. cmx-4-68 TaxID=2790938 RepID=UPI00397B8157
MPTIVHYRANQQYRFASDLQCPLIGISGRSVAVAVIDPQGGSGTCSLGESPTVGGPKTGNVVVPQRWQTTVISSGGKEPP